MKTLLALATIATILAIIYIPMHVIAVCTLWILAFLVAIKLN